MLPWERQPREGEEAYAAFLSYRDLGPGRTHEATRMLLGKRPGYLKPIERWSALRDWRRRSGAWDDHLQAERDKVARGGGGEVGASPPPGVGGGLAALPGAAGQAGADARHPPGDAGGRHVRAGRGDAGGSSPTPSRRPRRPRRRRYTGRRGGTIWRCCGCRSWSSSWSGRSWPRHCRAPGDRPADGDGRGDQGVPGPPSPPGPPAAALSWLTRAVSGPWNRRATGTRSGSTGYFYSPWPTTLSPGHRHSARV